MTLITIVVCTKNRADHLHKTLSSLAQVEVPKEVKCELLIVDNNSTDRTIQVVQSHAASPIPARYLCESRAGLSHARNTALATAQGEIILFTDDDVRPSRSWIQGMCNPILMGRAHAVAGGVRLAPHLDRPWMGTTHRTYLACTNVLKSANSLHVMFGANMAFSRTVLADVPRFDIEIGAGTDYTGEDTLFSLQLQKSGYPIVKALDVAVEHHFDEERLSRANFVNHAQRIGRGWAYINYHWDHLILENPRYFQCKYLLQLLFFRFMKAKSPQKGVVTEQELKLLQKYSYYKQYLVELERPHRY